MPISNNVVRENHTDDLYDIVTKPPAWILRWGVTTFLVVLILIIGIASILSYPDLIKAPLTIHAKREPKPIVSKLTGKIEQVFVSDGQLVEKNQIIAYLESTGQHDHILHLFTRLTKFEQQLSEKDGNINLLIDEPKSLSLGELQGAYQRFYDSYLNYKSSLSSGYYNKRRQFLFDDMNKNKLQEALLIQQQKLQEKDFALASQEYDMHKKLTDQKVELDVELKREEAKLIAKKYPLEATKSAIVSNSSLRIAKEQEIAELDNMIKEERLKFIQALNSLLSDLQSWKNTYVLSAPDSGKINLLGALQEGRVVKINEEIGLITKTKSDLYGEVLIPQFNMGKVKVNQRVLVKLYSYPFEEYGYIEGTISYLSDVPYNDSSFVARVQFSGMHQFLKNNKRPIKLKPGMTAEADIVTENTTLTKRIIHSFIKITDFK